MKSDLIDVCVEVLHETEGAWLVHTGDKSRAVWVPKVWAEITETEVGGIFTLTLPEHHAIDKGLV